MVHNQLLVESGLQGTSFRIGRLSGGLPNSAWSTTGWVPSLVKSSLKLGIPSDARGVSTSWKNSVKLSDASSQFVNFLPVHAARSAILEVAFAKEQPSIAINLVHPPLIAWTTMISCIGDALVKEGAYGAPLPLVPFSQWFQKLELRSHTTSEDDLNEIVSSITLCNGFRQSIELNSQPAIKLLDFFRGFSSGNELVRKAGLTDVGSGSLPNFNTKKARAVDQTMESLKPIGGDDAQIWIEYWVTKGFLVRGSF